MKPLRETIIETFYEIGTRRWQPCRNISNTKGTLYQKDRIYYGMPFSRRNWINYKNFCQQLHKTVYEFSDGLQYIQGVNCAGSVLSCFPEYIKFPFMSETYDLLINPKLAIPLGKVRINPKLLYSDSFIRNYDKECFYQAYSQLQLGDILCRYFRKTKRGGWYSHTLLITGNVCVKYNENQQIDEEKSYVVISENNYYFNKMVYTEENTTLGFPYKPNPYLTDITNWKDLNGKLSNFTFNKKLPFHSLFQDRYIPMTFKAYL